MFFKTFWIRVHKSGNTVCCYLLFTVPNWLMYMWYLNCSKKYTCTNFCISGVNMCVCVCLGCRSTELYECMCEKRKYFCEQRQISTKIPSPFSYCSKLFPQRAICSATVISFCFDVRYIVDNFSSPSTIALKS